MRYRAIRLFAVVYDIEIVAFENVKTSLYIGTRSIYIELCVNLGTRLLLFKLFKCNGQTLFFRKIINVFKT